MQQPRNRQEFVRMQEQAVAAARDMQRRAKFREPTPPAPPPAPPPPKPRTAKKAHSEATMHHKSPRKAAVPNAKRQTQWQEEPSPRRPQPKFAQKQPPPQPKQQPRQQQQNRPGCKKQAPRHANNWGPPPPPEPPPAQAPGLAELFSMFGNMGGGAPPRDNCRGCEHESDNGGSGNDSVLMILLMFLLQKEQADPGLMMALMYIMM